MSIQELRINENDIEGLKRFFDLLIDIDRKEVTNHDKKGKEFLDCIGDSSQQILQKNALRKHEKGNPRAKIKS